jgi:cardiolipin synthase
MTAEVTNATRHWLCTGHEVFPAMLAAIDAAQSSVCLETYIFAAGALADRFRDSLVRARQRGVRVRVLIDALGSMALPATYWQPLIDAGGEARRFNPLSLHRLGMRNHRKLLLCDERAAFIGGFNIAPEYEGDGVTCGWCDVGLQLEGPLVAELQESFEEMFARADFQHKRFVRFRKSPYKKVVRGPHEQLLLSGPGRGGNPIRAALRKDLARAGEVRIITAYFLPPWRMRRDLMRLARRGRTVQLILAGKSDVAVSRLAAQSLYRRFLRAGVEIFEYEPQILHAKMIIIDDVVYLGSANLDQRSLSINYELMIRFDDAEMAARARAVFQTNHQHSRAITLDQWRRSRTFWQRLKQRWAYLLLVRIDPLIARWQWRALPD